MEAERRQWAQRQQKVRRLLAQPATHDEAIRLWLRQHAAVHTDALAKDEEWSFEDEALAGLTETQMRYRPQAGMRSIVWLLWHIARIEDVTMNLLVAGRPQILDTGWAGRLGLAQRDVGTGMDDSEVADVSARIDIAALRAYRLAVGEQTRATVAAMQPSDLRQTVEPARITELLAAGAVSEAARGLAETWDTWTNVRFLLMPATRHSFTHLNEARRLRGAIRHGAVP